MSLTSAQKNQLKQQMHSQLADCETQIAMSSESSQTVELDQALAGRVSRIDAIQQQKIAKAGLNRALQHRRNLALALQHIDTPDYGYCMQCGDEISIDRLLIKPESLNCVACQQLLE